ncbi:hypothetical protein [Schleiferilactobacillus shenzhenensis]|nr:hypothetical protein [Schleiferilactobacillus shenzhenensis]
MAYKKSFQVGWAVFTDVLVLSILPSDTVLEILTSVTLLFPLSLGLILPDLRGLGLHFSFLDVLVCLPYGLLVTAYLRWTTSIEMIGNLFILGVSLFGLYAYINTKGKRAILQDANGPDESAQ